MMKLLTLTLMFALATFSTVGLAQQVVAPQLAAQPNKPAKPAKPPVELPAGAVGISISLQMTMDAVGPGGERTPTGHKVEFVSAPGTLEQAKIQWYGYLTRLTGGSSAGARSSGAGMGSLESLADKVIEAR